MAEPPVQARPTFGWIGSDAEQTVIDLDRQLEAPSLSADGNRLAGTDSADGIRADIWVADLTRGTTSRVTIGANAAMPVWCDDALFYAARDVGPYAIWRKDTESPTSAPVKIHTAETHVFPAALTADGSALAFMRRGAATRSDLWLLPLAGGPAIPLVQTPFEERSAAFSPDGSLLAYESSEAGRWDVYVLRRSDGKRVVVSRAGGTRPHWSADGSALYYQVNREVMRTSFDWRSNEVRIGPSMRVAITGDGELTGIDRRGRLLVRRPPLQPTSVTLALHWAQELRTLLGPPPSFLPR
jgi:Tol biopolymer transport system component